MKVSIVSLSYNKKEMTGEYIASVYKVYKQEFEKSMVELIIVDNASSDGAAEYLTHVIKKYNYKNVKVIANKENAGFAKGCNLGESFAKGECVIFLNNDSKVESKGFLEMAAFMEKHPRIAIMGGKMVNTDGSAQLSAWKFYTLFNTVLMLLGFERFGMLRSSPTLISEVDWVTGGCMMVRKNIFDILGGFDTHFFMYIEDMELCYRAKKAKYETYYYPDIIIHHIGQGSSNRTFAIVHIYKGILYFYKKHMPLWQYGIIKFCLYGKAWFLVLFGRMSNKTYFIQTYEQALAVL